LAGKTFIFPHGQKERERVANALAALFRYWAKKKQDIYVYFLAHAACQFPTANG